jgi:hypothetical protein
MELNGKDGGFCRQCKTFPVDGKKKPQSFEL